VAAYMKKTGVLNSRISGIIADMGHRDMVTICDAGLPVPKGVEKIDLAVSNGIPSFISVLKAVLAEVEIEGIILACEIDTFSPDIKKEILKLVNENKIKQVPHEEFKLITKDSKAIIRTGEFSPYANIILISGVVF
jgi:D-ribose pyranase